jgi:hypothetical protein
MNDRLYTKLMARIDDKNIETTEEILKIKSTQEVLLIQNDKVSEDFKEIVETNHNKKNEVCLTSHLIHYLFHTLLSNQKLAQYTTIVTWHI